jgi:hypothetical protein
MHRSQPLINLAWSLTTEQPEAEICFTPILYDARDSHRAFGKQHLEKCPLSKLCTLTIYILNIFLTGYVSKCTLWELSALSTGCSVVR